MIDLWTMIQSSDTILIQFNSECASMSYGIDITTIKSNFDMQ